MGFIDELNELLERTKNIKSPINCAPTGTNINEYNRPSDIWINDVELFYNKYLKSHPFSSRMKNIFFHRTFSAYSDLIGILESIKRDKDFTKSLDEESNMKDYEKLLKKLIAKVSPADFNIMRYEYSQNERPIIEKLEQMGLIEHKHYNGRTAVMMDLTYDGYHYFDEKGEEETIMRKSLTNKEYDVFISHANKDKIDFVDDLNESLKKLGINIFYDKESLEWGDHWKDRILDGTEKAEFAIIVISENFFDREWTEKELEKFLNRENEMGQKLILPIIHNITVKELEDKYPDVADIQAIDSKDRTCDEIALLFAKILIKRLKNC